MSDCSALKHPAPAIVALPEPDEEAKARSQRLMRMIRQAIDDNAGGIGFDRYMAVALYEPALGYYHARAHKFGAGGDFTTAPEISPLFAWCLARQCAQVLEHIGNGDVLEFGAGSGVLAAELLIELESIGALPRRYFILELSGELRQRQSELLADRVPRLLERVEWLQTLPACGFKGVVLANEVLDAMPVKCFALRGSEIGERLVGYSTGGELIWVERPADAHLCAKVGDIIAGSIEPLPDGYCSEFNVALRAWMRALAERMVQALVLIVDYGYPRREYYHPQRRQGTLLCHYRHRAHDDPFFYPGLQDISANVDFTAVAEAGVAAGLALKGYTSQVQFLLANGIEQFYARAGNDLQRLQFSQHIKRLILPSEMGERFQVMAFGKGIETPLRGFSRRDYRARL